MADAEDHLHEDHLHIERTSRSRLALNIAPLIDVVFLLLIFFMLTTSFLEPQAITLQFPPESTTPAPTEEQDIIVEVYADGTVALGDETLAMDEITARVGEILARQPQRRVTIRSERTVPVQRTVAVMDRVRRAGTEDIRFLTGVAE